MIATVHAGDFQRWVNGVASNLRTNTQRAMERTAEAAATYAKLSRLYKSHTYKLRESITAKATANTATVQAAAKYASWVENGTAPHSISARRKKALRFVQNGQVRFARQVKHPGSKPRPFMREAQEKAAPLFERLILEAVTAALST